MYIITFLATISAFLAFVRTQTFTSPEDSRVSVALSVDTPCNGVSTLPNGRIFLIWTRVDGSTGDQVVEYHGSNQTTTPYPNAEWNSYITGDDPATHFVQANSQRIGPDGNMWVVDIGSPAPGAAPVLTGGPKLVVINVTSNAVIKTFPLDNATESNSWIDDVRFNPGKKTAYLTDAGAPALIVLNFTSGDAVRVLENDETTTGYFPSTGNGNILSSNGSSLYFHADQLEVSPDGKHLYYQPSVGLMFRVETQYLDAALTNSSLTNNTVLRTHVEPFAHTPSTGGTAIDANGNIYVSDVDSERIIQIAPNGTTTILVQDPRLLWVDAMWVDENGLLWMPADQLDRGVQFHNGTNEVSYPLYVYTIDIGVGPSQIDHGNQAVRLIG